MRTLTNTVYLLSLNSSNEFDFLQQFTFSLYNFYVHPR